MSLASSATRLRDLAASPALADYMALTKPRITTLVMVTTLVGYLFAAPVAPSFATLAALLLGTALVAGGANALNQHLEREPDARMLRTRRRPLPAGRLLPEQALVFAIDISVLGVAWLAVTVSRGASWVAVLTLAAYVLAYTPLKRRTSWCTVVGAVPGALPPLIGWVAARGALGPGAFALFAILFFWQLPHFYAIAWLHRDDYARGGFPMLAVGDRHGTRTAVAILATTGLLIAASLAPAALGMAGRIYLAAAAALGACFLALAVEFARRRDPVAARRLFLYSVIYLPAVLALLVLDGAAPIDSRAMPLP